MKTKEIVLKELQINRVWHTVWLSVISSIFVLIVVIYPGTKAENNLLPLFNQNYFQFLFGRISMVTQGYILWISIFLPFITIIILLYSLLTGTRIVNQSISDYTGEILFVLPISRKKFLLSRYLANLIPFIILFAFQSIILAFSVLSNYVFLKRVIIMSLWGLLFSGFGLSLGIIIGLFSGNITKSYQNTIIILFIIYVFHVLSSFNQEFNFLTNINPLVYYQPQIYLLFNTFSISGLNLILFKRNFSIIPILLIILLLIFLILANFVFDRKDLIDDTNRLEFHVNKKRFHLPLMKKLFSENHWLKILIGLFKVVFYPLKSLKIKISSKLYLNHKRNNPLVFWARIFENHLPITADFIYSDSMTLFISVLAIILFIPIQIAFYPGNKTALSTIPILYSSGIFLVFSYGHILSSTPYLWYLIVNSIGRVWIILLPLSFIWAKKATQNDRNSKSGEIIGSLPINSKSFIYQRIIAIFSELIFLLMIMAFTLILAENLTNYSYNEFWEVMSIFSLFVLYGFLIIINICLFLYFTKNGTLLSGLFLSEVILSFILSILNANFNTWYFRGLFGLDDPVPIILHHSFFSNNFGLILLTILFLFSFLVLTPLNSRITFLNDEKSHE